MVSNNVINMYQILILVVSVFCVYLIKLSKNSPTSK